MKKNVTLFIDEDLWETSKELLPCSRSSFIENCLKNYIGSRDEITKLEESISNMENDLNVQKVKLEHLKTEKETNSKNETILTNAMDTVKRIINKHGFINNNQIQIISNNHKISKIVLTERIKENNLVISDKKQDHEKSFKYYD